MEDLFNPDLLLADSGVSEVFDAPGSVVYNVRSKLNGQDYLGVCAYVSEMVLNGDGCIRFRITRKSGNDSSVGYPYHWLHDGVMYAFKRNKQRNSDAFGLNHELFAIEWDASVILHIVDNVPTVFIASRDEWLELGEPGHQKQELQMFMEMPDYRRLPISMAPVSWVKECLSR